MTQYGECGESDYTMITFADLFDLRYARMFKGTIVSIDSITNTANIIILEACPEIAEKDLSAVPFFYHCEDSTGTVEDLARGYKAFAEDDEVMVLLVPENGETEERLFIIGHADVRTLKKCIASEYLLLQMNGCVTIFDTATGATLDLLTFENLDELSPLAPTELPCVGTTAFTEWLLYNFRAAVPACDIPGTGYPFSAITVSDVVSSSGTGGHVPGQKFGTWYSYAESSSPTYPTFSYGIRSEIAYGPPHGPPHAPPYIGIGYYTYSSTFNTWVDNGENTDGWAFTGTTDGVFQYYLRAKREIVGSRDTSGGSPENRTGSFALFSRTGRVRLWAKLLDGELREFGNIEHSCSGGIGYYRATFYISGVFINNINWLAPYKWNVCKSIGEGYIYTLTGVSVKNESVEATMIPPYPVNTIFADVLYNFSENSGDQLYYNSSALTVDKISFAPIATVTHIDSIPFINKTIPSSLKEAMRNSDEVKALGLENTARDLCQFVFDDYGWLAVRYGVQLITSYVKKLPEA